MGRRRDARERALQILFELEYNEADPEAVLARRTEETLSDADALAYSAWLVRGVVGRREEIDGLIQGAAKNWRVARMGLIDRNILRSAVYEMLEDKTLVPAIIINEAVDIARRFSGDESAVFVNGVLDAVRRAKFGGDPAPLLKKETLATTAAEAPGLPALIASQMRTAKPGGISAVLARGFRPRGSGEPKAHPLTPPHPSKSAAPAASQALETPRKSISKKDSHDRTQKRKSQAGTGRVKARSSQSRGRSPKK